MLAEEFMRAVSEADFMKLVGSEKMFEFVKYIEDLEQSGQQEIVLRALFQIENDDGVPLPYYLWLVYPLDQSDEGMVVHSPDFEDLTTYLDVPEELRNQKWFEIINR
jgi:hypothetical protein